MGIPSQVYVLRPTDCLACHTWPELHGLVAVGNAGCAAAPEQACVCRSTCTTSSGRGTSWWARELSTAAACSTPPCRRPTTPPSPPTSSPPRAPGRAASFHACMTGPLCRQAAARRIRVDGCSGGADVVKCASEESSHGNVSRLTCMTRRMRLAGLLSRKHPHPHLVAG